MKISVYKTKEVLVVAQHYFETEKFDIRHFHDQNEAADYIEFLAKDLTWLKYLKWLVVKNSLAK